MTVFGGHPALKALATILPTDKTDSYSLPSRSFEGRTPPSGPGQIIRVMQWNMLAQGLCGSSPKKNYCKTREEHLQWETRRYLLLLEILSYMPDILILQECDRFDFLSVKLKEFGYKGRFQERPFSPCVDIPGEEDVKPDGCAIFYHMERFHFVEVMHRQLLNEMKHSTSSLVFGLKLELVEDNTTVFVVNTHLKGGPKGEQNRYEACIDLLNFVSEHERAGDLVVMGVDICEEPSARGYDHLITKYKDAYTSARDGKHPSFTTWRTRPLGDEKYCNDIVLFNNQTLRVLQVLEEPDSSVIGEARLPNNFCASDHISLVCDLQRIMSEE